MKIFLSSIFYLILPLWGFAQADSSFKSSQIKFGINIGAIGASSLDRAMYVNFTMEKEQGFFSIGPVFGNKKNLQYAKHDTYFYSKSDALNGVNAVFRLSPHPHKKVFQSYFQNEFIFNYYTDKGNTYEIFTDKVQQHLTQETGYNHRQLIISGNIGWGFKLKFSRNFYTNQSIGFGLNYINASQTFDNSSFNSSYSYFNPNFLLEFGLGYTFDFTKRAASTTEDVPKDSVISNKYVWGVNSGILPFKSMDLNYYALLTLSKGKNSIGIGPIVGKGAEIRYGYSHNVDGGCKIRGLNIVYQRNASNNQRVNLYFQYDFIYRRYADEGKDYFYFGNGQYAIEKEYKSHSVFIENYVGYGLREEFRNFYLNQSAGLGLVYNSWGVDYQDVNYNKNEKKYNLGVLIKAGLGYKFQYKKVNYASRDKKIKQNSDPKPAAKAIFGVNSGALLFYEDGITSYNTNFTFEKGKNAIEIGPLFGKIVFQGYGNIKDPDRFGLRGINFIYQRIPKPHNDRFRFYFQNILSVSYNAFDGRGYVPYSYLSQTKSYHADQTIVADYLGYGCKIRFLNNFYIDQCFGLGIVSSKTRVNYENFYKNESRYTNPGLLLKLGVGYRFN